MNQICYGEIENNFILRSEREFMKKRSGFTLVEIAIVLVIIGLLLAAVLKGQEMITQGKIKGVINDFNAVMTAYNGYQDRYKALPGDDNGAAARWPAGNFGTGSAAAVDGNGNGIIAGAYFDNVANPATANEANLFWQHLRASGFYPGTQTGAGSGTLPSNSAGGTIGVENGAFGMTGLVICMTAISYKIAQAVDTQIDDGNAMTGSVRGALYNTANPIDATNPAAAAAPTVNYADGNTYVICRSIP